MFNTDPKSAALKNAMAKRRYNAVMIILRANDNELCFCNFLLYWLVLFEMMATPTGADNIILEVKS